MTRLTAIAAPSAVGAPRGKKSANMTTSERASTEAAIVELRATSI